MRVALRRLRASISLFSDMLTDAHTEARLGDRQFPQPLPL
jgi:hypothetical protein